MLQVVQYQKSGEMLVEDLPAPMCPHNGILVRTLYSLISAGTEKTSVSNAQSSMIQRAKKQPDQVKLVFDFIKKEGVVSTIKRVQNKLDSFKALGYSASGIVLESDCDEFTPGDLVACAGAGFANHAETIAIPKNLAARIPDKVSPEEAAYTTLGTIALQGVRQADLRLGETVAVVGLGLLGQITIQLLKASGCRVVGLDINTALFERAKQYGCDAVYQSNMEAVKSIKAFGNGIGVDAVILTASTSSNEPMSLAMQIARKKGRIVIVGAVGMDLQRSPFYEKELDIKISCSYGPGRYDNNYEEYGNDYPPAYVRWTENRNMQAFLDLIAEGKMDVKSMTTHTFGISDAPKAYDIITGKAQEEFLGILIKYPERKDSNNKTVQINSKTKSSSALKLAFIGAGSFAQSNLLPPLQEAGAEFTGVTTSSPINAQSIGKRLGFKYSSTDSTEMIKNAEVNSVFIGTRHETHAGFVLDAINSGKAVFVEKPLCTSVEDLLKIDEAVAAHKGRVMVGFNRRFSKSFGLIKDFFAGRRDPMIINYRVNAGFLPPTHWVFTRENGGRIIGEVCHFIDCMVYLTGALPVQVYAESISSANIEAHNRDNAVITVKFSDGSLGSIQYLANSDTAVPKEYCEVFCEGSAAVMNNFTTVELYRGGNIKKTTLDGRKGHREEVLATAEAMKTGKEMPISYTEIRAITLATFAAEESLSSGMAVRLL